MRIVTRPDFDGIVCAGLLKEVESITKPIKWVEPNDMQKGKIDIEQGDIIANLPYNKKCSLWFDHHFTNKPATPFEGAYKLAPSAAGIIYEYYKDKLKKNYDELIRQTDRIDAADLSMDEVLYPEKYPYILLSMTISSRESSDESYWNHLVDLIRHKDIDEIMEDEEVRKRCETVIDQNVKFKGILEKYTTMHGHVSLTDLRAFEKVPQGNRFLVYCMFADAVVSMKIRYETPEKKKVIIGVGHSIFNRKCNVNVGLMLSEFGGGGHRGAGSCTIPSEKAEQAISEILKILMENNPNE